MSDEAADAAPAVTPAVAVAAPPARAKLTWPEAIQAAAVMVSGVLAREQLPLPKAIERTQMFAEGLMERFG